MPSPTAAQALPIAPPTEAPFDIAVTQAASRSSRVLKHDDTFVLLDSHGDIGASAGGADGLFYHDTRVISRLEFLLHQMQPLMLGSNLRDDNSALVVDLTNPDVMSDRHIVLEKDTIHIVRTIFLWRDTLYQRFGVRNYGSRPIELPVSIHFASDFADLFEVRGTHRARHGTATTKLNGADEVLLSYLGLDGKVRRTTLTFDPPPQQLTTSGASYVLRLAPGESRPIFVAAGCDPSKPRPMPYLRGMLAARREMRERTRDGTSIQTSHELFNEMLCQSAAISKYS
jgi:glycogen debranching enzyme